MIEVKNLTQKYFYGAEAVKNVSFALNDNEKLAIFAKEGGGKTSLLKCIAGLYPAEKGEIIVNGKDIADLKPKDRSVRLIYSTDEAFFLYHTVKYNLEYPLKLRKYPKSEIAEITDFVLEQFGLKPYLSEPVYRLYPDVKIRLALARSALSKESVTLIDNVFCALTGSQRKDLFNELLPNIYDIPGNVIFATDCVDEALAIGNKLAVISNGKIVDFGTHYDVYNFPENYITDRSFRGDKIFGVACVNNGAVNIGGYNINLCDYPKDEVLYGYKPIVTHKDKTYTVYRFTELNDGGARIITSTGEVFVFTKDEIENYVSVDTDSIRLYDIAYENLLTNIGI